MGKYQDLAKRVGTLVDEKNAAYGNSFGEAGEFLRILYPNGVTPEQYTDMLCVVRIFDKLKRIATKKDAFGESPYNDIVGYGLLGLSKDEDISEPLSKMHCTRCGKPICGGMFVGDGDGDGQSFAHYDCFHQAESEEPKTDHVVKVVSTEMPHGTARDVLRNRPKLELKKPGSSKKSTKKAKSEEKVKGREGECPSCGAQPYDSRCPFKCSS
jgi:hypothetical protein